MVSEANTGVAGAQPMRGGPWGVSPQLSLTRAAEQRDSDAQRPRPIDSIPLPKEG